MWSRSFVSNSALHHELHLLHQRNVRKRIPGTATLSASFPASSVPTSCVPSNSAAVDVADRMACAGVKPNFTIDENSFAG
jgi:hypothetical protein